MGARYRTSYPLEKFLSEVLVVQANVVDYFFAILGNVLNLFLNFEQKWASCSFKSKMFFKIIMSSLGYAVKRLFVYDYILVWFIPEMDKSLLPSLSAYIMKNNEITTSWEGVQMAYSFLSKTKSTQLALDSISRCSDCVRYRWSR